MPTNVRLPESPNGNDKLSIRMPNRIINNITFFGDSAILEDDPIYKSVYEAAKLLAQHDYVVVNGGGPGLMKAATDGAESVDGVTSVVYWEPKLASFFEGKNLANIADETDAQSNYVNRTFGLIEKGDVYVVCKGGTGTISEFGLVWCLAKLYYGLHKPIILYGDFWESLIESFKKAMYIDEKELAVLYYAKEPEEIISIIQRHERKLDISKLRQVKGDEAAFLLKPHLETTRNSYNRHAHQYQSTQSANLVAKEQLDEFISLVNAPAQVLDIGCGAGFDTKYLAEKYAVKGIDISEKFVHMAQFENPNAEIIHGDITTYPLEKNTYKGIWARDSLHHIKAEDMPKAFTNISDALVDEGILYVIVREGTREFTEEETKSYGNLTRFYNEFTPQELIDRAEEVGLELLKIDHVKRSHKWLVGVFQKKTTN